jgi:hypothetical protein
VFNTPSEDHKVSRVLCNRDPDATVPLLSLDSFDSDTQAKIRLVASSLFTTSSGLQTTQYNVNARVIDTLMAYLLRHYPELKSLAPGGLAVQRMETCAKAKGFRDSDLLAWSSHLACNTTASTKPESIKNTDITKHPMFLHQAALIEQLIHVNQKLDTRLTLMETTITTTRSEHKKTKGVRKPPTVKPRPSDGVPLRLPA